MADNVTAPVSTGVFATDDIGGVHYPRTKLSVGADGAASDVSTANPMPTTPMLTTGGNVSVTTSGTGATYVALGSQACKQLTLVNNTGVTIEFRQGAAGVAVPIFDKAAFSIFGITNANQIDVRRTDTSNTTVVIQGRWES